MKTHLKCLQTALHKMTVYKGKCDDCLNPFSVSSGYLHTVTLLSCNNKGAQKELWQYAKIVLSN